MVTIGQLVSTLPLVVEVDPEFRTGLRASLMARIEREGIGVTATEPEAETPQRRRRSADLLPSVSHPQRDHRPPSPPARSAPSGCRPPAATPSGRRAVRRQALGRAGQFGLAGSDVSRGQLNLAFAKKRLAEAGALGSDVNKLTRCSTTWTPACATAARLLTVAAIDRGEVAGLQAIQEFTRDQRPIMCNLVNRLKGPAKGRATESLALLDRIDQRAGSLQQTAKCPGIKAPVDELGALPVVCTKAAPQQRAVRPAARRRRPRRRWHRPPAAPPAPAAGGDRGRTRRRRSRRVRRARRTPHPARTTTRAWSTASRRRWKVCSAEQH